MKPIFFTELKKYDRKMLIELCQLSEDDFDAMEYELVRRGILEIKQQQYSFTYVGIITYKERLLLFLPKYIKKDSSQHDRITLLKQILDALKVYASEAVDLNELEVLGNAFENSVFSYLSAIDFFINDYLEYGLYEDDRKIFVLNGEGTIEWNMTISENTAYLSHSTPIYLDTYNEDIETDSSNYIKLIHMHVLNVCSKFLMDTGLGEFFEYPIFRFDLDENLLGSEEFRLKMVSDRINDEYNDRKLRLLKALYNFINRETSPQTEDSIAFYGTKYFHILWEKACAYVLGHKDSIKVNIAKPLWESDTMSYESKDTLIPDILRPIAFDGTSSFLILDAKYYDISFYSGRVYGNPGIEDIIKQYMYEKALMKYINAHGYERTYNVLIFPTEKDRMSKLGSVSLAFLSEMSDILLLYLPAGKIFTLYSQHKKFDKVEWEEFFNELAMLERQPYLVK